VPHLVEQLEHGVRSRSHPSLHQLRVECVRLAQLVHGSKGSCLGQNGEACVKPE
jgi:hypothetical protein